MSESESRRPSEHEEVLDEGRRGFMKGAGLAAGGAVVGALGTTAVTQAINGGMGVTPAAAQAAKNAPLPTFTNPFFKQFGKYIYLVPGKFTGTVAALDLESGNTLAWLAGWNYGDTNPIMHHMAAFPSPDPYKGFEFIVNTQGGKNLFILRRHEVQSRVGDLGEDRGRAGRARHLDAGCHGLRGG
jgi:hypothetical protein